MRACPEGRSSRQKFPDRGGALGIRHGTWNRAPLDPTGSAAAHPLTTSNEVTILEVIQTIAFSEQNGAPRGFQGKSWLPGLIPWLYFWIFFFSVCVLSRNRETTTGQEPTASLMAHLSPERSSLQIVSWPGLLFKSPNRLFVRDASTL
jgi:hypothetical protein